MMQCKQVIPSDMFVVKTFQVTSI